MSLRLNDQQAFILKSLRDDGPAGAREIAERMNNFEDGESFRNSRWGYRVSYDRVNSILVRMSKRGLTERMGAGTRSSTWMVTNEGRQALG